MSTVNCTVPVPFPLAPDVMVIHASLLTAVHVQPDVVVTVTGVPEPPSAEMVWLSGATVNTHGAA